MDEAKVPPLDSGFLNSGQTTSPTPGIQDDELRVVKLTQHATLPTKATTESAGYDLYSASDITIPPKALVPIPTDISICPPRGTYGQILSRSGLVAKHGLETKAGTIDRDYNGNVIILVKNTSDTVYNVRKGDRVAQLVLYKIAHPTVIEAAKLPDTPRGADGFGSTGTSAITRSLNDLRKEAEPYNLWLSTNPFFKTLQIDIPLTGSHATAGMKLDNTLHSGRLQLMDMIKGTPGAKLPRWRSTLKRSILLTMDNKRVTKLADVHDVITKLRQKGQQHVSCTFATIAYHGLHPTTGSLNLYYDQLNIIGKHLQAAYGDTSITPNETPSDNPSDLPTIIPNGENTGTVLEEIPAVLGDIPPAPNIRQIITQNVTNTDVDAPNPDDLGRTFTLRELKQRPDWKQWQQARYRMLDSYHEQGMFSEPMAPPQQCNIHHMLWRYVLKMCGTRKARMVCDGSPRQGTITLGHTFANSLDAPSERLFWALVAKKGLVAYGADVSNAFAEAPPPAAPMYMRIDEAYRDWWENHLGRPSIPGHCTVVRVNNAIQGHPESPRLWEKLIDKILRKIGLRPTTHEPCLYQGHCNGQYTLFMRQVDDFAIATDAEATAIALIAKQVY